MKYAEKIQIKDGQISFPRRKLQESIKQLKDGFYFLTIEKFYKPRSTQQNRSLWGIPYKILRSCFSEAFGESVSNEFVHEFCKERFLPSEYVEKLKSDWEKSKVLTNYETKQEIELPFRLTTTKMSTIECMEYYKNMQRFCAEFFGQEIPDPDSAWMNEI